MSGLGSSPRVREIWSPFLRMPEKCDVGHLMMPVFAELNVMMLGVTASTVMVRLLERDVSERCWRGEDMVSR